CDPQVSATAARFIRRASYCEIEIDRNLVRERHRQVGDHRSFTGGQNDCDSFVRKFFPKIATQCRCRADQLRPAKLSMIDSVDHRRGKPSALQSTHAFFGKMSI